MIATLILIAAYLAGALPFAYLVASRWAGVDVRRAGSGNVGATNVLRTAGAGPALVVLALDVAKGAFAVWLARRAGLAPGLVAAAGIVAILGHVYPVWLGFRGGRGVATTCGVFIMLAPRAMIVVAAVFVLVVSVTRYVSLGAIVGAVVLPFATLALTRGESPFTSLAAFAAAIIVVVRHRQNVKRLLAGVEPTLGTRLRGGASPPSARE